MTRTTKKSASIPISERILSDYFHLSSKEVAKIYGMSTRKFREYCALRGITRWPSHINIESMKFIRSSQFDPRNYLHLSISDAAKQLNVSPHTFKKYCNLAGVDVKPGKPTQHKRYSVDAINFLNSGAFNPYDYIHLTLAEAAKQLNVSITTFRRYCCRRGLDEWPRHVDKQIPSSNDVVEFTFDDLHDVEFVSNTNSRSPADQLFNEFEISELDKLF